MRALKPLLLSAAIAAGVTACATTTSPTGRTQYVGAVSQAELNQLGAQAFAQLKAQKQMAGGTQQAYVRCVVNAVVSQLPTDWRQMGWESAVFVDDETNAFALPGGKVGAYTGIFDVARNQDQRITRQAGAQGVLGLVGALLGGSGYGQIAGQAGGLLAQTGFLLPGSRAQESEADVVGQRLMAQAGFDPRGAVGLWENMIKEGGSRPPEFLSTHPDPSARIDEMRTRAAGLLPTYEAAREAGRRPNCG